MKTKNKLSEGKVVLITGAAHGIGLVIAKKFANAGFSVVISDIQEKAGKATAESMCKEGFKAAFFKADLRKEDDIKRMVNFAVEKFKRLDIVINNARPKLRPLPFSESLKEWDLAMDVLLKAPVLTSKYALPHLQKSKNGCIINISSTSAFTISHQPAAYHIAKAAILQLTRYLAYEFGEKGVRVNAICPGLVNLYDEKKPLTSNPVNKKLVEINVPLKRAALAEEIADTALYLCSNSSSYLTGQTLILDGGLGLGDPFRIAQKTFYKCVDKK